MTAFILAFTILVGFLIVYHHVGYPIILKLMAKVRNSYVVNYDKRDYVENTNDDLLPTIDLIMPAYNEEDAIREKIRNIALIDYPSDKLNVFLICDGCTDETASLARETLCEPLCEQLKFEVIENKINQGKVGVINQAVEFCRSDIVALSDVSALISVDALLIAAAHFKTQKNGVVSGTYTFLNPASAGEEAYWKYQTSIKLQESIMGSTLGVHGAFYLFRRHLFVPLENNIINDDFVLPMLIVESGYKAVYEPRINAIELEQASSHVNGSRRERIAAGNVQQLFLLWRLIKPKYRGVAFNFISGKALRISMPFCLVFFLLGSIYLSFQYPLFIVISLVQLIVYGIALYRQTHLSTNPNKIVQTIHYLVSGYYSSMIGVINYLANGQQLAWKRANIVEENRK